MSKNEPVDALIERLREEHKKPACFSKALIDLKHGCKVARQGWNGKGMWLKMQKPDAQSKMTLPYIYIEYPEGHPAYPKGSCVPWLASQTDLLSEDWIQIEESQEIFPQGK